MKLEILYIQSNFHHHKNHTDIKKLICDLIGTKYYSKSIGKKIMKVIIILIMNIIVKMNFCPKIIQHINILKAFYFLFAEILIIF